jgi:pyruvate/2-oxoglutarate dehydrogenase complex dihydrolipoamide acyltransferase (E2) component
LLFAGTFTLSNLGMFGVDRFDAILPPGQVGLNPFLPRPCKL